ELNNSLARTRQSGIRPRRDPFIQEPNTADAGTVPEAPQASYWRISHSRSPFALSFVGLYIFTLLLYLRPNDIFPDELGTFPLVKIVALTTLVMYSASKLMRKQAMTFWPVELKCLLIMMALGVILIPWAANRQDSIDKLSDSLEKVAIIFI